MIVGAVDLQSHIVQTGKCLLTCNDLVGSDLQGNDLEGNDGK